MNSNVPVALMRQGSGPKLGDPQICHHLMISLIIESMRMEDNPVRELTTHQDKTEIDNKQS